MRPNPKACGPLCQGSCPLLYFSLFRRWAGKDDDLAYSTKRKAAVLNQLGQFIHTLPHVGHAKRNMDFHSRRCQHHDPTPSSTTTRLGTVSDRHPKQSAPAARLSVRPRYLVPGAQQRRGWCRRQNGHPGTDVLCIAGRKTGSDFKAGCISFFHWNKSHVPVPYVFATPETDAPSRQPAC